jgi:hypothetical protein
MLCCCCSWGSAGAAGCSCGSAPAGARPNRRRPKRLSVQTERETAGLRASISFHKRIFTIYVFFRRALIVLRAGGVGLKTAVPFNEAVCNVVVELTIRHFLVACEGRLVDST